MRESIGGTWILGLVVLFVVLFSAFLAISINYTKAFKVKNQIINIIEQSEGYSLSKCRTTGPYNMPCVNTSDRTEDKVYKYIDGISYASSNDISQATCTRYDAGQYFEGGYCIKRVCGNLGGNYYKVTSFVKIELPLSWVTFSGSSTGRAATFTVPVTGETRAIYYDINSLIDDRYHYNCKR